MKAKILFKSLQQDSQDYTTFERDDAHVVSVIRFDLQVGDREFHDLSVQVRQPYGTEFESEPLAMQRTASQPAFHIQRVCRPHFDCMARFSGLAIADLVSR